MKKERLKYIIKELIMEVENSKNKKMFFTSDLHFQDDRLNLYSRDLVFKNVKDVDNHIIDQWNKTVGKNDLTIVVGDVSMTKEGLENLNKLNGEKWLVKGNYDNSEKNGGSAKYDVSDQLLLKYFTKVVGELELKIGNELVYIQHYPTNAKSDIFNIVGHIHGTWKVQRNMINVGTDAWHFSPISEDIIKFQMNGIRVHYDQNVYAGELLANIKNRRGDVKILKAPNYDNIATFEEDKDVVIFLAGPIQGAPNWQNEFIAKCQAKLKNKTLTKNIVLASPRRDKKDPNFVYEDQVNWESFYLNKAAKQGIIVFWLPVEVEQVDGRSYAQTSRFELGEWWSKSKNILIGAETDFDGLHYIETKFKNKFPNFQIKDSIDSLVDDLIKKLNLS